MRSKINTKLGWLFLSISGIAYSSSAGDSIPHQYLNNNVYIEYNQQVGFIPPGQIEKKVMDYLRIDRAHWTLSFSPEVGTFVGERVKIGVFLRKELSNTLKDMDMTDVYMGSYPVYTSYRTNSVGVRCRYYLINDVKFRLPAGIAVDYSKLVFIVDDRKIETNQSYENYWGMFSEEARGIGLSGEIWANYYPLSWFYFGAGFSLRCADYFNVKYRKFNEYPIQDGTDLSKPDLLIWEGNLNFEIGMQF